MTKAPCYNCIDRHAGCHAECEAYQAWSEQRKQANQDRWQREVNITGYCVNIAQRNREYGIKKGTRKK